MQSGEANTKQWVLAFEPSEARAIDPLMGWTSSLDTQKQVRLRFDTREEAIAYAEKAGLAYQIFESQDAPRRRIAYADNFKWGRVGQWTH